MAPYFFCCLPIFRNTRYSWLSSTCIVARSLIFYFNQFRLKCPHALVAAVLDSTVLEGLWIGLDVLYTFWKLFAELEVYVYFSRK